MVEAGLMQRTGVERVLGASFHFRIIHVVVLRIVSLPSNTVLAGFDRKGRRFVAAPNASFAPSKHLVVRFDATVLYRFGKTSLLYPTAGDLRGGRRTEHHIPTVSAGLRHEGINFLMLLLLVMLVVLLLMMKEDLRAGIGATATGGEGSRFERCTAAGLVIPADAKRVHRFEARFVGIAVVEDGCGVGQDRTAAALQQHSGTIRFVPYGGTVGPDLTGQYG